MLTPSESDGPSTSAPPTSPHALQPSDISACGEELGTVLEELVGWDASDRSCWEVMQFTNALSNHVFCVSNTGRSSTSTSTVRHVVVRVFGDTQPGRQGRLAENVVFHRLGAAGVGPLMLGIFENGRVEEFLEGWKPIDTRELMVGYADGIAVALAQFHMRAEEALLGGDGDGDVGGRHDRAGIGVDIVEDTLEGRLRRWRASVVERMEAKGWSPESWVLALLRVDLDEMVDEMRGSGWLRTVLHGDVQGLNILWKRDGRAPHAGIRFVDFEYLAVGPVAYDLANHFAEWSWAGSFDVLEFRCERLPTAAARRRFVEVYLGARGMRLCGGVTVDALLAQCDACLRVSHYHWALWGVLRAGEQGARFDYLEYGRQRFLALTTKAESAECCS